MKNKKLLLKKFEEENNTKFLCKRPFELIEMDLEGNIYFCFPRCNNKSTSVGNLYEQTFEEISKNDKAVNFKRDILNSVYSYCDFINCQAPDINLHLENFNIQNLLNVVYPKELRLHIDNICNVKCCICRKDYIVNFKKEKEFREVLIPRIVNMCKNAEIIFMNGYGEVFFSPLARDLISVLCENYPNLKFDFCTNGLNFTPETISNYNLNGKIQNVSISMHAIREKTYKKIVIGGNFFKLQQNIKYLKQQVDCKIIKSAALNFVVNKYNYKEMKDFLKFAIKNHFTCFFSSLFETEATASNYYDFALKNVRSKNYKQLAKILNDEIFNNPYCILDNQLKEMRENSKKNFKECSIFQSIFKKL